MQRADSCDGEFAWGNDMAEPAPPPSCRRMDPMETLFTNMHERGVLQSGNPSVPKSGPGSSLAEACHFIPKLDAVINSRAIESVVDLGCGDLTWARCTPCLRTRKYTGVDIVKSLIDQLTATFKNLKWGTFLHANLTRDALPSGDLYLLKDVLSQHSEADVIAILRNVASSDFKWLLVTTAGPQREKVGQDLVFREPWHWRPIDLTLPPFSLRVYEEKWTAGRFTFILFSKSQLVESLSLGPVLRQVAPSGVVDARSGSRVLYYDAPWIAPSDKDLATPVVATKIPRKLHVIWIGEAPIAAHVHRFHAKWLQVLPSDLWTVKLWTNADLVEGVVPGDLLAKIREAKAGAQKADLLRLWILQEQGGWYFDGDHEPIHSIEPLAAALHWAEAIGCHYETWNPNYIANGALACVPGHPWIRQSYDEVMQQTLNTADVNWKTGPGAIARALRPDMEGIVILPPSFLYPVHYRNKDAPLNREGGHYTTHWWEHDW